MGAMQCAYSPRDVAPVVSLHGAPQLSFHFVNQLVPGECTKVMRKVARQLQARGQGTVVVEPDEDERFAPEVVARMLRASAVIDRVRGALV